MRTEFHTKRQIEFSDVDLAGFVHFSRFLIFMESAEHQFLRSLGTSVHTRVDGKDIGWPRLKVTCEYFSPAHFEDVLDVHLVVLKKGKKSMTYQITFKRGEDLIARGEVKAACCIVEAGKELRAIPIPEAIDRAVSGE